MVLPRHNLNNRLDLDNRVYTDLLEEARALIPTYDPAWTDHNPSDPGITLIELFAWLTEMLIYRVNRVPDKHLITFLKLLNGPDWKPSPDLAEDVRTSVVSLRQRHRAVTSEDYETLAQKASPDVARARCVPRRYLDAGTEVDRVAPRPGHVSVIIVPRSTDPTPQPSDQLRQIVWNYLDPRRVLTTRHHVVGPVYAPVSAEILLARRADVRDEDLRPRAVAALTGFLDPLTGGLAGDGWPFGRDIYVSELYELLEGISGVDYVPDIALSSQCQADATRCVAANELWHEDGELIGLELAAHHLPQAQIDPERIFISAAFVLVRLTIRVTSAESVQVEPGESAEQVVRRAVKTAVKRFFHPRYGGPDGTAARTITLEAIQTAVLDLSEITNVISIGLQSDPDRLRRDELGNVTGLRIEARELVDAQVTVVLG